MNAAAKPWEAAAVRFALCFPDVYEVGMSHLGLKILYEIINARPDALCERAYAPWMDMAEALRGSGLPLFSVESGTPLRDFTVLGFTLQYELSYTSVLEMLDLSGIPIRSDARGDKDPVVIAGGPCAFNPEPLAPFIDCYVIGDGEEAIQELIDAVKGRGRAEALECIAGIPGCYVPAFGVPEKIRKRVVHDLDSAPYPQKMIVPFQEIIHDRIMLEVMRGCTRGCRFCQAGMLYRPVRERAPETLLRLADALVQSTGYEEISLSSLSTGDYSCLPALAEAMTRRFEDKRVSLSLPSLRLDGNLTESLEQVSKVRKSSLTFAPEAGTQRLRDVINKGVTDEDIARTVQDAFQSGYGSLKLYFMIGLPTETLADIDGIAAVARSVSELYFSLPKGQRPKGLKITVSVSSFVPKPFTPFQWAAQDTREQLGEKQNRLREALRGVKCAVFQWHTPELSFLEACFARGDRRLAEVLEKAWRNGCNLDGWSEHFRFDRWMDAFAACGIDPAQNANRERGEDEALPWDFIDAGVSQAFLLAEKRRADAEQTTTDCRDGCNECGLQEVCVRCG